MNIIRSLKMGRIEYEYPLFKVYYSNNSNNSNIRGNPAVVLPAMGQPHITRQLSICLFYLMEYGVKEAVADTLILLLLPATRMMISFKLHKFSMLPSVLISHECIHKMCRHTYIKTINSKRVDSEWLSWVV